MGVYLGCEKRYGIYCNEMFFWGVTVTFRGNEICYRALKLAARCLASVFSLQGSSIPWLDSALSSDKASLR